MHKFLIFLFFNILFLNINAQENKGLVANDSISVSVQELLQNPEKFDRKYVAVYGFLNFKRNKPGCRIYFSGDDYFYNKLENSIQFLFLVERNSYNFVKAHNTLFGTVVGKFYNLKNADEEENSKEIGMIFETSRIYSEKRIYKK